MGTVTAVKIQHINEKPQPTGVTQLDDGFDEDETPPDNDRVRYDTDVSDGEADSCDPM